MEIMKKSQDPKNLTFRPFNNFHPTSDNHAEAVVQKLPGPWVLIDKSFQINKSFLQQNDKIKETLRFHDI